MADAAGRLGHNVSGLAFAAGAGRASGGAARLWAVRDDPGSLLLLEADGARFEPVTGWAEGRVVHWPDGTGEPDAEAVTVAVDRDDVVYVAAERDNDAPGASRQAVLEVPVGTAASGGTGATGATGGALVASRAWELTGLLPPTDANTGIEGLAWIPDAALVAGGFTDDRGRPYDPAAHPGHGGGLFVTGAEAGGRLDVFALGEGAAEHLATIPSGLPSVMELAWDADAGLLWAACDDHCDGRMVRLAFDGAGSFTVLDERSPPDGLEERNDEGLAIGACRDGTATVVWSDDAAHDDHALRAATLPCSNGASATTSAAAPGATGATAAPTATSPTSAASGTSGTSPTSSAPAPDPGAAATVGEQGAGGSNDPGGAGAPGLGVVLAAVLAAAGVGGAVAVAVTRRRRAGPGST